MGTHARPNYWCINTTSGLHNDQIDKAIEIIMRCYIDVDHIFIFNKQEAVEVSFGEINNIWIHDRLYDLNLLLFKKYVSNKFIGNGIYKLQLLLRSDGTKICLTDGKLEHHYLNKFDRVIKIDLISKNGGVIVSGF